MSEEKPRHRELIISDRELIISDWFSLFSRLLLGGIASTAQLFWQGRIKRIGRREEGEEEEEEEEEAVSYTHLTLPTRR